LPDYAGLVAEFPEVVNAAKTLPAVTHQVEHFIEKEGRPGASKYRRLYPESLAAAKEEFEARSGQPVRKHLVIAITYGLQGGRVVAAMWQF
jgi:hypothetical protein